MIEREKKYPTGFDLEYMGVAIPYVDSEFICRDGIWVMSFQNQFGTDNHNNFIFNISFLSAANFPS